MSDNTDSEVETDSENESQSRNSAPKNNNRPKLSNYQSKIYAAPIKASHAQTINKNVHKMKHGQVTAVLAIPHFETKRGFTSSSNSQKPAAQKFWRVLLDSGSDGDLLFVQKGTKKASVPYTRRLQPHTWHTSNGIFQTKYVGDVHLVFPEYSSSKRINLRPDIIEFENPACAPAFDLIIGTHTMKELGIVLNFKSKMITIDQIELPMRRLSNLQTPKAQFSILRDSEPISTREATNRSVKILDAKYEKADLPKIVRENCTHLTEEQQQRLLDLLLLEEELFDGTLGCWKTKPVKFKLKEGATPYHGRAFPIPVIHRETLKKEVERLCKIGVLRKITDSEWASPTFIIPKKEGTVRFISDFREVNKRLVRTPWPLPKISDILQSEEGLQYATALDLNMGYYTIRLDPTAQEICTIILPWGKYCYQRLPMGIAGSPDIFQEKMTDLMSQLEYVRTYIDDLLLLTKTTFNDHLNHLAEVLKRLRNAGLKVNAAKSKFCAVEVEYLGYILSRDGITSQPKKVQAILAIDPPTSVKTLRSFLGIVQYYRDMWEKRSHMLAPLTDLVAECGLSKTEKKAGKKKKAWYWNATHQEAFDTIKATIARDVVLAYPDFSKPFEIYTDASTRQLGAVIVQNNRPIAFFSRKLTDVQQRYSVTDIELLAIIETLEEFRGMLLGREITIYTDHKNLTSPLLGHSKMQDNRLIRWRWIMEEYGPTIIYIKGIHNTVADAISRLDYDPRVNPDSYCHFMSHLEDAYGQMASPVKWKMMVNELVNYSTILSEDTLFYEACDTPSYSFASVRAATSFVYASRSDDEEIFPLTIMEIADCQRSDKTLKGFFKPGGEKLLKHYSLRVVEDVEVLCEGDKIVIPAKLQTRAIQWYHHWLQHPGHTRLEETLRAVMTWPGMRDQVRKYVKHCKSCQFNKRTKLQYGHVPPKQVVTTPWEVLCVDLIGPYTLKGKDGSVLDFMCLTMIDPATSWFEMVEIPVTIKDAKTGEWSSKETFDKTSAQISRLVNKSWFSRYPRCRKVIYDNGSEFKLHFKSLCDSYGLKRKPTTIKNPQANAILERLHQVIVQMLRTAEIDMADSVTDDDVSDFLDDASWAIRSTYHTVLKATPGAAIFGRDMMFDIPFVADWYKIGEHRQKCTDKNTQRENSRRVDFDYAVGMQVLLRKDGILRKAETKYDGPYTITTVYTNGTIRIQRGTMSERLNIRRVKPYFPALSTNSEAAKK